VYGSHGPCYIGHMSRARKLFFAAALACLALVQPLQTEAQTRIVYGDKCCDVSPDTGAPRARCFLRYMLPLGNPCWCDSIVGTGFVCY